MAYQTIQLCSGQTELPCAQESYSNPPERECRAKKE